MADIIRIIITGESGYVRYFIRDIRRLALSIKPETCRISYPSSTVRNLVERKGVESLIRNKHGRDSPPGSSLPVC